MASCKDANKDMKFVHKLWSMNYFHSLYAMTKTNSVNKKQFQLGF